jgi:hypothetical protein
MLSVMLSLCRSRARAPVRAGLPLLYVFVVLGQTGCSRSLRQDGAKVAQVGSTTAKQMAEYYQALQKDTIDTYELNSFRDAYLTQKAYEKALEEAKKTGTQPPPPPSLTLSDLDKEILKEYQQTYQALGARVQLAQAMQDAYGSLAHLSEYNATDEVNKSVSGLSKAVSAASGFVIPDPTGTVTTVVQGLFKDILGELTTSEQNRVILRENRRVARILVKLQQVFDAEKILCGGDRTVPDSQGNPRKISGIAGRRAAAYKSVAELLVESDAVVTTAMLNRVLGQYEFRWPEPQVPFSQPALKAGMIKIIEARSLPIVQLTEDSGDGISRGLGKLSALHTQLAERKPLSLQEALENSATVQVLLDQLKSKGVPTEFLLELLKVASKGE